MANIRLRNDKNHHDLYKDICIATNTPMNNNILHGLKT